MKKGVRSWKWKVQQLLHKYNLEEQMRKFEENRLEGEWNILINKAMYEKMIETWRDGVRAGKKLTIYSKIKQEWGCKDYLAGTSKGVVLMIRF